MPLPHFAAGARGDARQPSVSSCGAFRPRGRSTRFAERAPINRFPRGTKARKPVMDHNIDRSTSSPHRFLAAAFAVVLLLPPQAIADPPAKLSLQNGSSVEGEVLKSTDTDYFVDLGFDVLKVPADYVAAVVEKETAEGEAEEAAPGAGQAQGPFRTVSYGPVSFQEPPADYLFEGSSEEMIELARQGVVHIKCPSKTGSGFVIDKQGYIVSNRHVVEGEKFVDVTIYYKDASGEIAKKTYREVELIAYSALMDISLLKIKEKDLEPELLTPLPIATPNKDAQGTTCFAIGNPGMGGMALAHTVSRGLISSTERVFNDIVYLQTDAAVNPGNSGGPLLDSRGTVIGLVTYKAMAQDNIAFALPVPYIRYFLERHKAFLFPEDRLNTGVRYQSPIY
jgi:serine protease Do